ncbi:MAG: VCBS repeat-containing protein [Verrucomicrobia subdivision 3 bacterium]|nr:VCBS repeat-containing protein [Limisphaerales bacterium]
MPTPDLMGKEDWKAALKRMAGFLGIARPNFDARLDGEDLKASGLFPPQPLISSADWSALIAYYVDAAPADVAAQPARPAPQKLQLFKPRQLVFGSDAPCTSLLQLDPRAGGLWVGDAQAKTLTLFATNERVIRQLATDSAPVSIINEPDRLWVALIGRILPSDERLGQVWALRPNGKTWTPTRLLTGLRRPVEMNLFDMDGDQEKDLLIASFGNMLGRLSWFSHVGRADRRPLEHSLQEISGSVQSRIHDWNRDGKPDLTVLRAQGMECVEIYSNQGNGTFTMKKVIEFPPTYGCCRLELADFDSDSVPELIVVNGDKGDYACGPRGYHGVRIFQRAEAEKFVERYFFPLYGAYGVKAADFDGDGDLDLALISFFPDYDRAPDEGFVYLRNDGDWQFQPFVMEGSQQGRWIVLDAGDVDGDTDVDIVLGSFVRGPRTIHIPSSVERQWETQRLSVLLLENTLRSP